MGTLAEAVEARMSTWVEEQIDEVLDELAEKVKNYVHDEVATHLDIDTESALSQKELDHVNKK